MKKVHVITMHEGYEPTLVVGIFSDRNLAFSRLEELYDSVLVNGEELELDYEIEDITEGSRQGWTFGTGDYEDAVELVIQLDVKLEGASSP